MTGWQSNIGKIANPVNLIKAVKKYKDTSGGRFSGQFNENVFIKFFFFIFDGGDLVCQMGGGLGQRSSMFESKSWKKMNILIFKNLKITFVNLTLNDTNL